MRFTDQEELARRRALRQRQRRSDVFWNVLTALVVLATLGVVGFFLLILLIMVVTYYDFMRI